jgi:hypothetical protein
VVALPVLAVERSGQPARFTRQDAGVRIMFRLKWIGGGLATAVTLIAGSTSALAQRSTAEEIAREIRNAAEAIGTVRDAVDQSIDDVRWRGVDREAIRLCAPRLERYGRMRVDDVRPYGRRSIRVYGTVDRGFYSERYRSRDRYGLRSFTCTVRDDGRVKVKTRRLRR